MIRRWDERLANWALWVIGGKSEGVSAAYDGEFGECAPRPPPPLIGEAEDTEKLMQKLARAHPNLWSACRAWYVWTGTLNERAKHLRIHRDTLRDRVDRAHEELEALYGASQRARPRVASL